MSESPGRIYQDTDGFNVLFVHSTIDDAKLTPFAFRVYCHVSRRANRTGSAWPGSKSMADACQMSETTVKKAIKELEDRNMLQVRRSTGGRDTNTYFITAPSKWTTPPCGDPVATRPPPPRVATPTPSPDTSKGTPLSLSIEEKETSPTGSELFDVEQTKKISKKHPRSDQLAEDPQVQAIYKAYPRHKQPVPARRAIAKAIKKIGYEKLIAATLKYADYCKRAAIKEEFIPYPATWYNAESWDDKDLTHDAQRTDKKRW